MGRAQEKTDLKLAQLCQILLRSFDPCTASVFLLEKLLKAQLADRHMVEIDRRVELSFFVDSSPHFPLGRQGVYRHSAKVQ